MTEFVAPSAELHKDIIRFAVVEKVIGNKQAGHFNLADRLVRYTNSFAYASIQGPLTVLVTSTASPTNALTAWVATQPSSETEFPTEAHQIATYNSHVFARDGVFSEGSRQSLLLTEGIDNQIKPIRIGSSLPVVVYHTEVAGGTAKTEVLITITGTLKLNGIGYIRSWAPAA